MAIILGTATGATAADLADLLEKKSFEDAAGAKLRYRFMKPAAIETGRQYPLVVFLHGAGERGDDNTAQLIHGVGDFASAANREKYPCFLIAPQCPKGKLWANVNWSSTRHDMSDAPAEAMRLTLALIDQTIKEQPIDSSRIYITGLSMGGYGTWDAIGRRPGFFAAAVPICGGADIKTAEKIKHVPVWAFHGDKDMAVPVSRSRDIVEALKKSGGTPKYTEYPGVGHDSWTETYKNPDMLAWLFAQKLPRK